MKTTTDTRSIPLGTMAACNKTLAHERGITDGGRDYKAGIARGVAWLVRQERDMPGFQTGYHQGHKIAQQKHEGEALYV